jgi:lipopolysaccharide transport system ATP-binding protein
MSSSVIEVQDLSKKFVIHHEQGGRQKYDSLRDVITNRFKRLSSKKTSDFSAHEDFWALRDVNFKVEQGERVGIIGRNGAGKSTLLKILSQITEPTSGSVRINGRVASLLEVGTGFHPELTGRENIFLNGAILGMSRSEVRRKFDEIVAFAEIEKFLDTPVKRYSSGMYVRLAFAVAAHLEPEILILDEVLAVGDVEFQKKCFGKVESISKGEGRTILFVSHNMGAVSQLCNSALLLHKGQALFFGEVQQGLQRYSSLEKSLSSEYKVVDEASEFGITFVSSNEKLNARSSYSFDEEIRIVVELNMPRHFDGLHLGIAVNDKWKRKLFTTVYKISKKSIGQFERFECQIPSKLLLDGTYTLDVASFIPNGISFSYLKDICPFEVTDFASSMAIFGNSDVGVINVNCEWR